MLLEAWLLEDTKLLEFNMLSTPKKQNRV